MSREIKFRVWDKTTNTMFENDKNTYITIEFFIGMVDINGIKLDYENECEAVLMQYTGLKDKNGKEIYDGDVLKQVKKSSREGCESSSYDKNNFEVVFKYGSFWLQRPYDDSVYIRDFPNIDEFVGFECFEIVGNIYENPELLEN